MRLPFVVGFVLVGGAAAAATGWYFFPTVFASRNAGPPPKDKPFHAPRQLAAEPRLTLWWDAAPDGLLRPTAKSADESNVRPSDYVGPDACQKCHPANYESWSAHPHRVMNVLATDATVKGDFSSGATIDYRGGKATFAHESGDYLMRLERDGERRTYRVTQTIGSRFFQYYVGRLVEGPEPADHHFYSKDHVLFFGYWLSRKEWVPIVHVGPETPDADRADPFQPPESGRFYAEYAASCNYCHTTFPLGDMLARRTHQMGEHAPSSMHWIVRDYLDGARPAELSAVEATLDEGAARNPMASWDAAHYAATFGVSCEACHLGGREHVESDGRVKPKFFPASPQLSVESVAKPLDFGRTHDNINWACGRCHTGGRPAFAAGMSTWNSVEFADAARGACYSKMKCIDCHSPHEALGPTWKKTPDQDDAVCLKCHAKFQDDKPRLAHTHHPAGSEGARCLNCHMPRINEGLQDVVRTHMIYSPTRADMIEKNHPNACNLCHTDKPIDWTLGRLKEWYGKTYDDKKIAAAYPDRGRAVGDGWLNSRNESVRLVAADASTRTAGPAALPKLLDALDDPFMMNRQFAMKEIEDRLGFKIEESGYRFYMTAAERRGPLADLRARAPGAKHGFPPP
jgi:predicted CXXCH cytochrome family protein